MEFKCDLFNIQHISRLSFSIDLSKNQLMCVVGKNSIGKTTLIRSIKNLQSADTFEKTASPYIFNANSHISYKFFEKEYSFQYNSKLELIDTKEIIDKKVKQSIHVELPIPHGERFNHFQKLGEVNNDLRKSISLKNYSKPDELISFLSGIYKTNRFDNLKEISVSNKKYYFILKEDDFYIREDYLSSGEHFVINLYKVIQRKCKLIVIDEIDISLDASAQVNLLEALRKFCTKYEVNIVFTTHSLVIMKKLSDLELYYMENNDEVITLKNVSYNYIKSELFGFHGWDKYILTEDKMLKKYLTYLISQINTEIFFQYNIIYIGGASQVVDLMRRNITEQFFSSPDNVISVLDGDKENEITDNDKVIFIPFESVEKQLFSHYQNHALSPEFIFTKIPKNGKELYSSIREKNYMSDIDIFSFINNLNINAVEDFKTLLISFLNTS